jgi:hypothetical protein
LNDFLSLKTTICPSSNDYDNDISLLSALRALPYTAKLSEENYNIPPTGVVVVVVAVRVRVMVAVSEETVDITNTDI